MLSSKMNMVPISPLRTSSRPVSALIGPQWYQPLRPKIIARSAFNHCLYGPLIKVSSRTISSIHAPPFYRDIQRWHMSCRAKALLPILRSKFRSKSINPSIAMNTSVRYSSMDFPWLGTERAKPNSQAVCMRDGMRADVRTLSQYVAGIRHLEQLKDSDDLCMAAMRSGQFSVFYNQRALVGLDDESGKMRLVWISSQEIEDLLGLCEGVMISDAVLLSSTSRDPAAPARFALHVPEGVDGIQDSLESALSAQALGIRKAMFTIGRREIPDLLQAYALLQWHSLQTFCSKCRGRNEKNLSGSKRVCSNCGEVHYPTMKPVVITLVVNGDRCLVARQPQFPEGMYSALAGFCDMGETLEDAVRREVAEEVGIEVKDITYFSSQHWPLPSSGLMLGCYATVADAGDTEIVIDRNELEDARWLGRQEVQGMLGNKGQSSLWLPPRQAIAHHLLREWALQR